jgi:thermitase
MVAEQTTQIVDRLTRINQSRGVVPNELLLTFKSPEALAAFKARAPGEGLQVLSSDGRLLSARVKYADPAAMSRELANHGGDYNNVGPNYLVWVPGLPQVPKVDESNAGGAQPYGNSGLQDIGAYGDRSNWGHGITVAVLDTGITTHPLLEGTDVVHYDLVQDGQTPNGHGTAMASLIAGNGYNEGGAAPDSRILDVRVADISGESNTALVAQGIMQAIDQGAKVINISLGTSGDAAMLRNAVAYALEQGVIIVAAAGNDQLASLSYPAAYDGVISVGALDAAHVQAYFSNSGSTLTISAPGVGIVSGYSDGQTVIGSGTSQATAITSGVVAYMLGRGYAASAVPQVLATSALNTGAPKEQVGAGLVQIPR